MKTTALYYADSHMRSFTATVTSCEEKEGKWETVLNETAFFPEGGGQPADTGYLGGARVTHVFERDEQVVHITDAPLKPGAEVYGEIDWPRRFDIMQQHSGEHIMSGVIHSRFGFDNVGFHIGLDYVTLDLSGFIEEEQLYEIEDEVNEAIWRDLPIITENPDSEALAAMQYRSKKQLDGQVRIVRIPGYDACACCGVHVKTTGEIGVVKIVDSKRYKGGVRLTIRCGKRALLDHREKQRIVRDISVLLSAKPENVYGAVEQIAKALDDEKYKTGKMEERFVSLMANLTEGKGDFICAFPVDLSAEGVWKLAAALSEKHLAAAVFSGKNGDFRYALASSGDFECDYLCKDMNRALKGRGGGTGRLFRGTVACSKNEAVDYFSSRPEAWFFTNFLQI